MRIVILGDFHMHPDCLELTSNAIEDINAVRPDWVIPLGDFGPGGKIGKPEGLEAAWEYLQHIQAPMWPILGNHDLQEESAGMRTHGEMREELKKWKTAGSSEGFIEFEHFRIMLVTTDPQPADSCWQVQECYVSPEQWARLYQGLQERRGVPVIVFSHAPPIGAGLRTVPKVHVRSTNAWLDQNHEPDRWRELYLKYPEILLWFSAHYHLGHNHHDAISEVEGTFFFQSQIHGNQTRDGTRQSRVLDIDSEGNVEVLSLDHIERKITGSPKWKSSSRLAQMIERKKNILENPSAPQPWFYVTDTPFLPKRVFTVTPNHLVLAVEDGHCWEIDLGRRFVMGSYHTGSRLTGVALNGRDMWRSYEDKVTLVNVDDMGRFMRKALSDDFPGTHFSIEEQTRGMAAGKGRVTLLGEKSLWMLNAEKAQWDIVSSLPETPEEGEVRFWNEQVVYLSQQRTLWLEENQTWKKIADHVVNWEAGEGGLIIVRHSDKGASSVKGSEVTVWQNNHGELLPLRRELLSEDLTNPLLVYLQQSGWWLSSDVDLFQLKPEGFSSHKGFWTAAPSALLASEDTGKLHALFDGASVGEERNGIWENVNPLEERLPSKPFSQ